MKNTIYVIPVLLLLLLSCSSPESEGKALALRLNKCSERYIKNRQKAATDFVSNFNASDYSSRAEALEVYDKAVTAVLDEYNADYDEISIQKTKIAGKFADDYNKRMEFKTAYKNNIDSELRAHLVEKMADTSYPEGVLAVVKSVVPVKPDISKIQEDLVGHKLYEGFERKKCFFPEDWAWSIEENGIRNFEIEEVLSDNSTEYIFIATMRLEGERQAFNARVKIAYWLPGAEDWKIEFVKSMGLSVVKTNKYDDLVEFELKRDGWGGGDVLHITNKSEIELMVGLEVVAGGKRQLCARRIAPGGTGTVGGLFCGGNVSSYEVKFVERY